MQFPESWLRSWCDPKASVDEIAHRLTMAGLEVEQVEAARPEFEGVVVARIVNAHKHPQADKLQVCEVDDGSDQLRQVVCGASNVTVGMYTALAKPGARLPGGKAITSATLRGVPSEGMLCSAQELGLANAQEPGILVLANGTPGEDLRQVFPNDTVLTLKLTPNRADCLSIAGVARELSAICGVSLKPPPAFSKVAVAQPRRIPVRVDAPDLCGRFISRTICGINNRVTTPDWMRARLELAGQRCVSPLVDISNYVMLERGRPSHIFDADAVRSDIVVRWGKPNETLELLDGTTIELTESAGILADQQGPLSLAGIMGGARTAVTADTVNVLVEAAYWWPDAIAGRTRHYRLTSEAAHRFERGVDFESLPDDLEYLSALLISICGGQAGPIDDQLLRAPKRSAVQLRFEVCNRRLGLQLSAEEITAIFDRLAMKYERTEDGLLVEPPSYRQDLHIEADLIEEVARLYGYDRIPAEMPLVRATMLALPENRHSPHWLRQRLVDLDYTEVINFSFVDARLEQDLSGNANPIKVLNPIASHMGVMRSSLLSGLLSNLRHNLNHRQSRLRIFEIGRVFKRSADVADGPLSVAGIDQPQHVGGLAYGPAFPDQWGMDERAVDFFDVKGDLERLVSQGKLTCQPFPNDEHQPALHPGRCAQLLIDNLPAGWLGELHPQWVQAHGLDKAPVVFELKLSLLLQRTMPVVQEISRYPAVTRDFALLMPSELPASEITKRVLDLQNCEARFAVVQSLFVFDHYQAPGESREKSLAFRVRLQAQDHTLSDSEVESCMQGIFETLQNSLPVRLRQ